MCCLSSIAGAATTDAPKLDAEGPGAQLAQACTNETNPGGTAGEENVRTSTCLIVFLSSFLFSLLLFSFYQFAENVFCKAWFTPVG